MQRIQNAILNYTTHTEVSFRAPPLKVIYYFLCACAITYFLLSLTLLHNYANYEPVVGLFNIWIPPSNFSQAVERADRSFCLNPKYGVEGNQYVPPIPVVPCLAYPNVNDISEVRYNDFEVYSFVAESPMNCTKDYYCADAYYLVGIEHTPVKLSVGAWTRSLGTHIHSKVIVQSKDPKNQYANYVENELPEITLGDVISWGGKSLNDNQYVQYWGHPRFRMSGMRIIVSFEFSNMRAWDMDTSIQCLVTTDVIEGVFGQPSTKRAKSLAKPNSNDDILLTKNSVHIILQARGSLGQIDPVKIVTSFTSLVVLLGLARKVIEALIDASGRQQLLDSVQSGGGGGTWLTSCWGTTKSSAKTSISSSSSSVPPSSSVPVILSSAPDQDIAVEISTSTLHAHGDGDVVYEGTPVGPIEMEAVNLPDSE